MNCPNCGGTVPPGTQRCAKCGSFIEQQAAAPGGVMAPAAPATTGTRSKMVAGLLGIFLGYLGIHRFYLGYSKQGGMMLGLFIAGLVLAIPTCGLGIFVSSAVGIWGLVEGILILTGGINKDAQGAGLKD